MHKRRERSSDASNFTFMNSIKSSLASTPNASNNASFYNTVNSSLKNTLVESISFRNEEDSHFKSSAKNKENMREKNTESKGKFSHHISIDKNSMPIKRLSFDKKDRLYEELSKNPKKIQIDLSASIQQQSNAKQSLIASITPKKESQKEEKIKVFIRIKPKTQNSVENKRFIQVINDKTIKIQQTSYCFDKIFKDNASQQFIYENVGKQMCKKLFEGFNGSIIAYGQTGSGKTFTIFGEENNEKSGIIYRCVSDIIKLRQQENKKFVKIKCSMVQLYKETFIDMLSLKTDLKIKENKGEVYLEGLKEVYIDNEKELVSIIKQASKNRKVASTLINEESSRSHTVLSIFLETGEYTTKLCLIDLAGSEKVCKSGTRGETFQEAKKINYSLTCFANVINALTTRNKHEHIPFRDSKLTRILKDSLTGNFLTSIIVNCSSQYESIHETISSLKFAERAKKIKMNVQSLENKAKEKEKIVYLKSVVSKLKRQLQKTQMEIERYRKKEQQQKQNLMNQVFQESKGKLANAFSKSKLKRCKIFSNSSEKQNQKRTVHKELSETGSQDENTARFPIPSERALVEQNMNKYQSRLNRNVNSIGLVEKGGAEVMSLNVSRSVKTPFLNSPEISVLEYKENSPDLSLSFSIQGQVETKEEFWG